MAHDNAPASSVEDSRASSATLWHVRVPCDDDWEAISTKVEASGYRIAEGGVLVLYRYIQPPGCVRSEQTVKAFAPHAWLTIERENGREGTR